MAQRSGTRPSGFEYDSKVTTTSEAIAYVCALGGKEFAVLGDLGWQTDHFALLKLTGFGSP
jgi:hypothetical protein